MFYSLKPIPHLKFALLDAFSSISHFITTRHGGISKKPYDSLNICFNCGDNSKDVLKNRNRVADSFGIALQAFTSAEQTHTNVVHIVSQEDKGKGSNDFKSCVSKADSLITNISGVCLMVRTADCVPILVFDPVKRIIGTIHAGWRGTLANIAGETIRSMEKNFSSKPKDVIVCLGPSIGVCCFEVQKDVWNRFKNPFFKQALIVNDSKTYIDVALINKLQLMHFGISEENIEIASICTVDRNDIFYTARKDGKTGRFASCIMLSN